MSKPRNYTAKTRAAISEAWKRLAHTSDGQLIIADLMVWCNAYSPIETSDPIEMARLVGENNVAKYIAGHLGYRPQDFAPQADEDLELLNRMTESVWAGRGPPN